MGTPKEKRDIIGSIYPEKLTFEGERYRTKRLNEAVRQIYLIEKELQECKNGTSEENFDLCRLAERGGLPLSLPRSGDPLNEGLKSPSSNLQAAKAALVFCFPHPDQASSTVCSKQKTRSKSCGFDNEDLRRERNALMTEMSF